jgi:isoquinoline 1-oxidoreductase beta subunit
MIARKKVTRRDFLKTGAGGAAGLVLSFHLPETEAAVSGAKTTDSTFAPNAYLQVRGDNTVTFWVTRSEMGQGVRTTLPMILADELEVEWSSIELQQAPTTPAFEGIRLRTSGSGSSAGTWPALRRAGATAREMLISAASQAWRVDRSTCRAERGEVLHRPSGRRLSYGELADAASKLPVPKDAPLKAPKDFRIVGRPMGRVDGPKIVRGEATYGLDVRLPNMRYAAIARCPYLGGKVVGWEDAKTKSVAGVQAVVPVRSGIAAGVAVVASSTWAALRGREVLQVRWDPGPHRNFSSEEFYRQLIDSFSRPGYKVRHEGDAPKVLAGASRRLQAVYQYPFQAHAPLEPMNCVADVRRERCEIWAPTQAPRTAQEMAAGMLGLERDAVKVNVTLLGGGFGRRLLADYAGEAVEVSRAIGAPVQVVWTRVDDTRYGFFQPAWAHQITCGMNEAGQPIAWLQKCVSSSLSVLGPPPGPSNPLHYAEDGSPWGAFDNPYNFPTMKVDYVDVESPVPTGPWRAVEYPPSVFARECFLDELAHALHRDPLQLRLELLEPGDSVKLSWETIDRARLKRVLEVAAEKSHWSKPLVHTGGRRWGRGLACNVYHGGSYIAQVAEISTGENGDVRVHRVVCVVDCGRVVNPLGLEGQMESGVVWGLSATLFGQIRFQDGGAVQTSYADFPVVRIRDMPVIETHFVPSPHPPGGFGEHPVPPLAPAVANAILAATGKRIRKLPILPNDLREV